jgi:hypothetical protein
MKRIPKSVKIGCHSYDIVLKQEVISPTDGDKCNALIMDDLTEVWVERGLKRQKKQEYMLHEIIHGLLCTFPFDDDEIEEKVVTFLAPALMQLLQDNPELISYLTT